MEGLEISVLNLSEVLSDNTNRRIDSEYFRKQFISFFKDVPDLKPLGDFVKEGYRVVYEKTKIIDKDEAIERDFPYFLQATDLDTPFIKTDNLYHVHQEDWERYEKGRINPGEILIEVKGKIDKVAIVPDDFPSKTLVTGSLFKLTVNDKISKHLLLTYLICKYGVAFKDRFKTNLLISYVSKPDLYRIPVPNFSQRFNEKIDIIFNKIFESKRKSKEIYKKAEEILFNQLGLNEFSPSTDSINIKSFNNSFKITGRLDAEYYQPKYEDIVNKIVSQSHDKLSSVATITKSIEPGSKYYDEIGLPFMRVADFSKNGLTTPNKFLNDYYVNENAEKIKELKPKKGTILFSKDGSVGNAYHLRNNFDGITSSAILHLNIIDEKRIIPEYLTLVLNSELVQMQAERDAGGSIILHWRVSEIQNVIVPIIDYSKQQLIANMIEESFVLSKLSERLLEVAKSSVEMSIEFGEEKALEFINKNIE